MLKITVVRVFKIKKQIKRGGGGSENLVAKKKKKKEKKKAKQPWE